MTLNRHMRRSMTSWLASLDGGTRQDVLEVLGVVAPSKGLEEETLWPFLDGLAKAGAPLRYALSELARLHPFQMPGVLYPNHHRLVAERGSEWSGLDVVMSKDVPALAGKRMGQECYEAAWNTAQALGIKYVEGWLRAWGNGKVTHVLHGWAYDPRSGKVIESHLKHAFDSEDCFVGVVFEPEQVSEAIRNTGFVGMFGADDRNGYDLLRRGILGVDYATKGG